MTTEYPIVINSCPVQDFIKQKPSGVFLLDPFPRSNVAVYHRMQIRRDISNGVVLLGDEHQLSFLSDVISERLISRKHRDGFWSGVFYEEGKLYLAYKYDKQLVEKEIIELLIFKFRDDMIFACRLKPSELSFIQIKHSTHTVLNIPIMLSQKQREALDNPQLREIPAIVLQ